MYGIIKSVISAGGYKLADIQYKVKKLYILGDLDDVQMEELLALAAGGISADAERPETLIMLRSLDDRISALEKKLETEAEAPVYEAWQPWDGISDKYQYGVIVSHGDQLWQSVHNGQNVWEPGAPGTEALWVIFEEV